MSSKGSFIKNLRKHGHTNVSLTGNLLVKSTNDNCTKEDIHLQVYLFEDVHPIFVVIVVTLTKKL